MAKRKAAPMPTAGVVSTTDYNTTLGTGLADANAAINAAAATCLVIGERRVYIAETPAQVWGALNPTSGTTPAFVRPTIITFAPAGQTPPTVRIYSPGLQRALASRLIDYVIGPNDIEWPLT